MLKLSFIRKSFSSTNKPFSCSFILRRISGDNLLSMNKNNFLNCSYRLSSISNRITVAPAVAATATFNKPDVKVKKSGVYTRTGDKGKSSLYTGERRYKHDLVFEVLGTLDEVSSAIGVSKEFLRIRIKTIKGFNLNGDDEIGVIGKNGEKKFEDMHKFEQMEQVFSYLQEIQQRLMDISTIVATPAKTASQKAKAILATYKLKDWIAEMERLIDLMDNRLPQMKDFILPGGSMASAHLHVSRSVCRRAERCIAALIQERGCSADLVPSSFVKDDENGGLNEEEAERIVREMEKCEYDGQIRDAAKYINRMSDYLFVAARYVVEVPDIARRK